MERISSIRLLGLIVLVALAEAQRNLPYPTTKQPTTNQPGVSTTVQTVTTTSTSDSSTTPAEAPYPAAGYRPGREFNLPTEERKDEIPNSSYGPPTESPTEEASTTAESAPYAPSGYRPGKAFNLPTEERKVPETSYGPPTEQSSKAPYPASTTADGAPYAPSGNRPGKAFNLPTEEKKVPETSYGPPTEQSSKAPYPSAGYRPSRAFNLPTEDGDDSGSGDQPTELDQSPADTEIVTSIRFPDGTDEFNDVELARIMSGRGVLQTRPSGFRPPERIVEHRYIRPGPNNVQTLGSGSFQPNGPVYQRPLRPARRPLRPVGGTQTVLQARPSFGFNSGVYDREPVLITTIRLPDPFAFTSFLDDF